MFWPTANRRYVYAHVDLTVILQKQHEQQHAWPQHDTRTTEAAPSRVGRGERGESRNEERVHREVDFIASKIENGAKPLI